MLMIHIKTLIAALLHTPDQEVISVIASEMSDTDTAGQIWLKLRKALNSSVGNTHWDPAILIAGQFDARIVDVKNALTALKFPVLSNPDEWNLAAKVFANSRLKSMLVRGGSQTEIVTARNEFLVTLIGQLTEIVLFPRRSDFYHIARSQADIKKSWLPYGEDDYFHNAYLKLLESFSDVAPFNYSAFIVAVMRTELIKSLTTYDRLKFAAN